MGLFKSKDERRIEREMKIRQGLRSIEKSIRQQEKFSDDFIKNAQHAKKQWSEFGGSGLLSDSPLPIRVSKILSSIISERSHDSAGGAVEGLRC